MISFEERAAVARYAVAQETAAIWCSIWLHPNGRLQ
jgi:hypothetical protein